MAISDWSTTAALNVLSSGVAGSGGVNIDEGCAPSGMNNAQRDVMAQLKTFFTSGTITGAAATFTSTDAGAAAAPILTLYRNSATPAAADIIGQVLFQGEDSAGNTQDYGSIDTVVDDPTSTSEDATLRFRTVVAGTMTTGLTLTGTTATLTSTDAGATAGPTLDLYRDSATPAVSDILGSIDFNGEDSAGNKQLYARIHTLITDPTSTSEDSSLRLSVVRAGSFSEILNMTGASITMTGTEADMTWNMSADTKSLSFYGGNSSSAGGNLQLYGSTHATEANNYKFRTGGSVRYGFDHSLLQHQFVGALTSDSTVRLGQNSSDTPGVSANVNGVGVGSLGQLSASTNGAAHSFNVNADGTLIAFRSNTALQGSISIAGATTSYNPFFGSHFSQPAPGIVYDDILRGTIVETIDELSDFEVIGERLPRYKISDTAGSDAVYGVFHRHDHEAENRDEIGALGAYFIRIDKDVKVRRGNLIESNGNGCGRVQKGKDMLSSTVGKVSAAIVVETYPDGSYLVPCTLHCG